MIPNLTFFFGAAVAAGVLTWSLSQPGAGAGVFDMHGVIIVLGGSFSAVLISTPARHIFGAVRTLFWSLVSGGLNDPIDVAAEMSRLSKKATAQGGILSLRGENSAMAGGFLQRAIDTAAACGETNVTKQILELDIRRRRITRTEDANVFRTLGTLSPMFGLLGTLLGMLKVMSSMSDPSRLGPAMALALSSAFIGIGMANFICIPIAGQIRLLSMRETQIFEMIVEGIIAISTNQPTYQVDLRLGAFLSDSAREKVASRT